MDDKLSPADERPVGPSPPILTQQEIDSEVGRRDKGKCAKPGCKTKMAMLEHDPHSLCEECRGQSCSESNKCHDCEL